MDTLSLWSTESTETPPRRKSQPSVCIKCGGLLSLFENSRLSKKRLVEKYDLCDVINVSLVNDIEQHHPFNQHIKISFMKVVILIVSFLCRTDIFFKFLFAGFMWWWLFILGFILYIVWGSRIAGCDQVYKAGRRYVKLERIYFIAGRWIKAGWIDNIVVSDSCVHYFVKCSVINRTQ